MTSSTEAKIEKIELIADSGIQFYSTDITIDLNAHVLNETLAFSEEKDWDVGKAILDYATFLHNEDVFVREKDLRKLGFYKESGEIDYQNLNLKALDILNLDEDCYIISDILEPLNVYSDKWIPLPFFESNNAGHFHAGPSNWCRLKLVKTGKHGSKHYYKLILAFDTKLDNENKNEGPTVYSNKGFSQYKLCGDSDLLLDFCRPENHEWVDEYLEQLDKEYRQMSGDVFEKDPDDDDEFEFIFKYVAFYIYFVKYFAAAGFLPNVKLYRRLPENSIDVDLVLDIGNSRTNGILIESPKEDNKPFDFTTVDILKLKDLTDFTKIYDDPFSMRLAFSKANFGEIGHQTNQFVWPSFVRLGKEAKSLIYMETEKTGESSRNKLSNHSSPKRYLWDNQLSKLQWELVNLDGEDSNVKSLYIEGISQQFKEDGSFTPTVDFGATSNFSRKSLMTFVLIEILAHAITQINSVEFRTKHGSENVGRKLRRIVITCPTAMTRQEQVILRQCAEDAAISITRFYNSTYDKEYNPESDRNKITIVPSVKDSKRNFSQLSSKIDWIYDESTCCQLVFIYAEVAQRYNNKAEEYFNLYGKVRNDLEDYDKKSVTIGSIDIGAGTTDLMINAYKYNSSSTSDLTPHPLYWESFNLAGDNLVKAIVQQVILEGDTDISKFKGCTGVISNFARKKGVVGIERKMNTFFGTDSNNLGAYARRMRQKFNVQISIPIAERYLAHASDQSKTRDVILDFDEMFDEHKPNKELLDYFAGHFGFRFEEIQWTLSREKIDQIIVNEFDNLIKHLSILLYVKGCDFVLLAGRPTSLTKINDLFLKYYPVSPDRIISLNDYRVGRWYPFQDGNGYFIDHKSIVSVGAGLALMGGKLDRLSPFRLNMNEVKRKLIPTSEYFGIFNSEILSIDDSFITPDENRTRLKVGSLPLRIASKQLPSNAYPARLIYVLDFDDEVIKEKRMGQLDDDSTESIMQEVESYKISLKDKMPFIFTIAREYRRDREILKIESVTDYRNQPQNRKYFTLKLKTLDEKQSYWLDTGEFILSIKPK